MVETTFHVVRDCDLAKEVRMSLGFVDEQCKIVKIHRNAIWTLSHAGNLLYHEGDKRNKGLVMRADTVWGERVPDAFVVKAIASIQALRFVVELGF
ncbi:hypothetical protein GOBAR_DD31283 [Gossypium barbadense]|nr:hypothetical protein GOBAR_DD31283 [Gossypium barbadense]